MPYTFTAHAKDIFHESVSPEDLGASSRTRRRGYSERLQPPYLREKYGPAAQRVRRVYNGLDLRRFPYRRPAAAPCRGSSGSDGS